MTNCPNCQSHCSPYATAVARGHEAGYRGESALKCPYTSADLRRSWFDGHQEGARRRRLDLRDGRLVATRQQVGDAG